MGMVVSLKFRSDVGGCTADDRQMPFDYRTVSNLERAIESKHDMESCPPDGNVDLGDLGDPGAAPSSIEVEIDPTQGSDSTNNPEDASILANNTDQTPCPSPQPRQTTMITTKPVDVQNLPADAREDSKKTDSRMDASEKNQPEPTASTSKGTTAGAKALQQPRKSLPLLPRMSQYEKHPLLQVRSGTGLSEFEMFLLEKELFKRRSSASDQWSDSDSGRKSSDSTGRASRGCSLRERKLIPRGAHYEPHPLLKKSVSGVCELEMYLMEKDEEAARRDQNEEAAGRRDDAASSWRNASRSKLEPRSNQWEKHALLEIKDEAGLSEVERFFMETEIKQRGKCGAECVCKSANCRRCKMQQHQQHQSGGQQNSMSSIRTSESSSSSSSTSSVAAVSAALLPTSRPTGQQKKVRFEKQKNDTDDSGIASSDVTQTGSRPDGAAETGGRRSGGGEASDTKRTTYEKDFNEEPTIKFGTGNDQFSPTEHALDDRKSKRNGTDTSASAIKKSCCMS